MLKKKDRVKIVSKEKNLKNVHLGNIDDYYDYEYGTKKKALQRSQNKNKSSLKSKTNLKEGLVLEIMSNNFFKVEHENVVYSCIMSGRLKQYAFKQRRVLTVGDLVNIDFSDNEPYRIEEIKERKNKLMRYTDRGYQKEILIASNMDYAVITVSCIYPMLKLGLIDRFIIQAVEDDIEPVICINKIDLIEDISVYEEMISYYIKHNYKVFFVSAETGEGLEEFKELLKGKVSVFSGQSGVGKSSLINKLKPGINLRVNEISEYNEKGRHTTTSSRLIKWDFGGYLVDTPGIKTVSLKRDNASVVYNNFPGFVSFPCYFNNCTHTHENHCGVKEAVENGDIPEKVYQSYIRILGSV